MTDDDPWVDQFSEASRARLVQAAVELTAVLARHTARLSELTGGTRQVDELFALNDEVRRAAAAWDDAVSDHTGTLPLAVNVFEDDAGDEDDDTGAEDDRATATWLSLVSRWDLVVDDVPAVIEAGRAAHRRSQPDESEEDARAAIGPAAVEMAVFAIAHEAGEPWFSIPGVEVDRAHRAYVFQTAEEVEQEEIEEIEGEEVAPLLVPPGKVAFRELW